MRVLARYGRYAVQIRPQIVEAYATGHTRVIQSPLTAQFREGLMTPEERALAKASWTFNGFYQEQDEVTQVEPDYRIGVFDSIQAQADGAWSDDDRRAVEEELVKLALGFPTTLIVIAETKLPPPWPTYDSFAGSLNALCTKIVEDGFTLEAVLAYEEENQDRPDVVAALQQMMADAESAPVERVEEVVG